MPKQKLTNDDYWAVPVNVLARNGFQYCSGLLCGSTKSVANLPHVRFGRYDGFTFIDEFDVYSNFNSSRLYGSTVFQRFANSPDEIRNWLEALAQYERIFHYRVQEQPQQISINYTQTNAMYNTNNQLRYYTHQRQTDRQQALNILYRQYVDNILTV